MKQLKNLFLYILPLVFIQFSCKEDINLIGEIEETAIVYGLLDVADSVHYIKITRAFIGPGSSLDIAKIPDSSYFNQVQATITEYVNGVQTNQWNLTDTTILNKDVNGAFYAPSQKVFCFYTNSSNPLKTNAVYKLNANINNGEFAIAAETDLVSNLSNNIETQNYSFKFATNPATYVNTSVILSTGNSYVINTKLAIKVREIRGSDSTDISIPWTLGESDVLPGSSAPFIATGAIFYDIIKKGVTNDPSIIKRKLLGMELTYTAGAEELYNYMIVNKPSSSLAQTKPTYTNITATNGQKVIGVFSSRFTKKVYKPFYVTNQTYIRCIDKKSTQELCNGPITGSLLFCSYHVADQSENYYCQ